MPIYEYLCLKCGHRFEELTRKISTCSKSKCPKCGAAAERQLSTFGISSSSGISDHSSSLSSRSSCSSCSRSSCSCCSAGS